MSFDLVEKYILLIFFPTPENRVEEIIMDGDVGLLDLVMMWLKNISWCPIQSKGLQSPWLPTF